MKRTYLWSLIPVLLATLAGCGGRTLYSGNGNGNLNTNANGNSAGDECQIAADCRVARKWDTCCSCPEAVSDADLAADPCLIPLEQSAVPDQCFIDCPAIACPICPDAGRTVDCLSGECAYREGRCADDTECVAAIRTDNCCEQAFPATHDDIAADPCLTYWPLSWQDIPQACWDAWPEYCDSVDCAPSGPSSRAMYCASDGCAFGTECTTPSDCTLLIDHRACCSCPQSWPASMVGHDPCILPVGEIPPAGCMPEACDAVQCEQCLPPVAQECTYEGTCIDVWAE